MARLIIVIFAFLVSCSNQTSDESEHAENSVHLDYSKEFIQHFKDGPIQLKADSLIFPEEAGNEVVLIPTYLILNRPYLFTDWLGRKLKITRVNYTDIEFEITADDLVYSGSASISPNFHLGAETVDIDSSVITIDKYIVNSPETHCLYSVDVSADAAQENLEMFSMLSFACKNESIDGLVQPFWLNE